MDMISHGISVDNSTCKVENLNASVQLYNTSFAFHKWRFLIIIQESVTIQRYPALIWGSIWKLQALILDNVAVFQGQKSKISHAVWVVGTLVTTWGSYSYISDDEWKWDVPESNLVLYQRLYM